MARAVFPTRTGQADFCGEAGRRGADDALTIQGAPLGRWGGRRVHLFGGRVRTGSGAEFVIAAACVGVAALVVWQSGAGGFLPFFCNWGDFYAKGLIDGLGWRGHRFNHL